MKVTIARPFVLNVLNNTDVLKQAVLFQKAPLIDEERIEDISIKYGLIGYSYSEMCEDIKKKDIPIRKIRLDMLDLNTKNYGKFDKSDFIVEHKNSSGEYELKFKHAPNQFIFSARELDCDFILDTSSIISLYVPAKSGIRLSFFPPIDNRYPEQESN